jgi:uncharacterized circularly permuted ATP-grasp superfamily protein
MFGADSNIRNHYSKVINYLSQESPDELNKKEELAKRLFMSQGITFTVYNSGEGSRRSSRLILFPALLPLPNGSL